MNTKQIIELSKILSKYFDPKPILDGASAYQAAELVLTRLEDSLKCSKHPTSTYTKEVGCEGCFLEYYQKEVEASYTEEEMASFELSLNQIGGYDGR